MSDAKNPLNILINFLSLLIDKYLTSSLLKHCTTKAQSEDWKLTGDLQEGTERSIRQRSKPTKWKSQVLFASWEFTIKVGKQLFSYLYLRYSARDLNWLSVNLWLSSESWWFSGQCKWLGVRSHRLSHTSRNQDHSMYVAKLNCQLPSILFLVVFKTNTLNWEFGWLYFSFIAMIFSHLG